MSKDHALLIKTKDLLAECAVLDKNERGMYFTLILTMHQNGPISAERLGLLLGSDWEKIRHVLLQGDDGLFFIEWLEKERARRANFIEKQSVNGKKGGRPKNPKESQAKPKPKAKQKPKNNPSGTVTVTDTLNNKGASDENLSSDDPEVLEPEIYPTFEDFWNAYDKKVGREAAEKKWDRLTQEDKEKIMQHIEGYKISSPDKKYRKNPETYLNQKAWNDEIIFSDERQFTSNPQQPSTGTSSPRRKADPTKQDVVREILGDKLPFGGDGFGERRNGG
jgi:hypothetical protein